MKPESYEVLLNTYSRERKHANRVKCECGKYVYEKQLEKHINTKMHATLMTKLAIYNEYKNTKDVNTEKVDMIDQLILSFLSQIKTLVVS